MGEPSRCRHDEPKDTNIIGNITKLLPANTFLMFQMLAPLSTNDGHCGLPEKIMTSAMLIILASTCMLVCFTDTLQFKGKVFHGLVTRKGLWNPSFKNDKIFETLPNKAEPLEATQNTKEELPARKREDPQKTEPSVWNCFTHLLRDKDKCKAEKSKAFLKGSTYSSGDTQYELNGTDFLHAVLSTMAFGALTMLTSPVTTCFYPKIPVTVLKTLPLLVGFVISGIFAFSPPARNDIAHPLPPKDTNESSQTPGKGDSDNTKPPVDDDLGGSVKKHPGKFLGSPDPEKGKLDFPTEHHQLPHKATPAVAEPSEDIHIALALQETAKSVSHDALVAGLVKAGAHPALAIAAVQDAKDAALTQMHHELQAATTKLQAGLSGQSFMALTRENSMLPSRGSSLTLPSSFDVLFHEAAQFLQRQVSGLSPNVHAAESVARQKAAPVQSFAQPVTSLAQDTASGGSQSMSDAKAEFLKQKEDLTQEMNSQARALSAPTTTVAQNLAALVTTQVGSPPTVSPVNSQYNVAQGMAQAGSQPAASVVIDITSLPQRGSQMHAQLTRQASASSPQMQVAATTMQRQVSLEEFQQSSAADTHMAFRHLASQLSSPPLLSSPAIRVSQGMSTSRSNWRDNASVIIEGVTATAAAGPSGVGHAQREAEQLPRVTEEIVAQTSVRAPIASQVALASRTHNLHPDRQESTEIMDSISTEEITSESEAELSNRGDFRAGSSSSFNLQGPLKRKE